MSAFVLVPVVMVLTEAAVVEFIARRFLAPGSARLRTVRGVNAIACLGALLLVWMPGVPAGLRAAAPLLSLVSVGWLLAATVGQARATPLQVPGRYSVPLEHGPGPTAFVSWRLQLTGLAVLVATTAVLLLLREHLPAQVPLHIDLRGRVDRVGSPRELYALGAVPLFLLAMPWLAAWCAARERWALPAQGAEEYAALQWQRRLQLVRLSERLMLVFAVGSCTVWMGVVVLASFFPQYAVLSVVPMLLSTPVSLIVLSLHLQSLQQTEARLRELAGGELLGTRARGWRAGGLVYFAPEDPALVVPRRIGLGWTFNLARPAAWGVLAGLVLGLPVLLGVAGH